MVVARTQINWYLDILGNHMIQKCFRQNGSFCKIYFEHCNGYFIWTESLSQEKCCSLSIFQG